jgi:hypothetical protein
MQATFTQTPTTKQNKSEDWMGGGFQQCFPGGGGGGGGGGGATAYLNVELAAEADRTFNTLPTNAPLVAFTVKGGVDAPAAEAGL